MDRKQGIIHLGKSKSPERFRSRSRSKIERITSLISSRQPSSQGDNFNLNHSMHVSGQSPSIRPETINLVQTHPGFFPPSSKVVQQVILKQHNKVKPTLVQGSPIKKVVGFSPAPENTPPAHLANQTSQVIIVQNKQNQMQLLRKIKMLQSRVQELHQEKQVCIVKSHQQNKRLCFENAILQAKLLQTQNRKSHEINALNHQISSLISSAHQQQNQNIKRDITHSQTPSIAHRVIQTVVQPTQIWHKVLKNGAYVDQLEVASNLNNSMYKMTQSRPIQNNNTKNDQKFNQLQEQNKKLGLRVQSLELENSSLKKQINQLKDSFMENSAAIQSNNKKIIQNYTNKVNSLMCELQNTKHAVENQQTLKNSLQSSKVQVEEYVHKLLQSSQQKMRLQCQYKDQVAFYQGQCEEYVSRLLVKMQGDMKLQSNYKVKIGELEAQIKSKQAQLQSQLQSPPQSTQACPKCKELIKTLVKLNQKVFSKTS